MIVSSKVAMKIDYGKLRHFCDDPVCPDPVWKLSTQSVKKVFVVLVRLNDLEYGPMDVRCKV